MSGLWGVFEIELVRDSGVTELPVSDALLESEEEPDCRKALRCIRLLPTIEWPHHGRLKIERVRGDIYVLKCWPGHWRIYFAALTADMRYLLLLAIKKKKDKRDADDIRIAERRLQALFEGRAKSRPVKIAQ